MKTKCFFLILVLSSNLYCQNKISKGKIDYIMILSDDDGISNYKSVLYFNELNSRFVYSLKKNISSKDSTVTRNGNDVSIKMDYRDTTAVSICIDKDNKKTYTIPGQDMRDAFYEDFAPQKWTISTEHKQIGKFMCYKATTSFRGRNYIGFYTLEIPISTGPFKFSGLPGLLLELYDTQKEVIFEATQVTIPYEYNFDLVFNPKSLKIREEYNKRMKEVFEKLNEEFTQSNRKESSRSGRDGKTIEMKSKITVHKGIELD